MIYPFANYISCTFSPPPPNPEASMKRHLVLLTFLLVLFLAFGCASTKVSDRERYSAGKLPRPAQIIVYDFVTNPEGVAPDSALIGQTAAPVTPPTAEQVELEKQLGVQMAEELADQHPGDGPLCRAGELPDGFPGERYHDSRLSFVG